jgi:methionyl-tRNA formyltransferase
MGQISEFIPKIKKGNYLRIKQDDRLSNTWRKRGGSDGQIDFRMGSKSIYNFTRSLIRPYISAHIKYKGKKKFNLAS